MASWILIAAGKALFAEFDRIAPSRDHASDGSIGDTAHQHEVSDHNPDETGSVPIHDADSINEVHAIDVDTDLRESDLTMEKCVQFLLGRCRSGAEKRFRYIIYNHRIWSASSGWIQKTYTGASAHTEHAHFSFSYISSLEASTASYHLEEVPVALTDADKLWIKADNDRAAKQAAKEVWGTMFQRPEEPAGKVTSAGAYQSYNDIVNRDTANAAAKQVLDELGPKLDQLLAKAPTKPTA